jgi:hypothetical protein
MLRVNLRQLPIGSRLKPDSACVMALVCVCCALSTSDCCFVPSLINLTLRAAGNAETAKGIGDEAGGGLAATDEAEFGSSRRGQRCCRCSRARCAVRVRGDRLTPPPPAYSPTWSHRLLGETVQLVCDVVVPAAVCVVVVGPATLPSAGLTISAQAMPACSDPVAKQPVPSRARTPNSPLRDQSCH